MIFYFSATGNSKYVARCLAEVGETLISIPDAIDRSIYKYNVADGEKVGIISPTYDWTVPSIVEEFIEKLVLVYSTRPYMYYVGTFGTTTGAASSMMKRYMAKRGYMFDAYYDVTMPDTWTPMYDLSDKEKVHEINRQADIRIQWVKNQILQKATGKHMNFTTPYITGVIGKKIYDDKTRYTRNLSVTDSCVGCGLCAKKCPVHAIDIMENRPVWTKERCTMCLGCLHRCPEFAIQYGKNTGKHGQYVHQGKPLKMK